ncbi:MAG: serine/threonine-protein kinase, partial [Nannocystaceae bacterium]
MDTYSHEQITKPSIATGDDAQSLSEDLSIGSVSGSLSFSEARVRRPRQNFSGRTVGERYKLEAQLGRGGMATVYRAIDLKLNKPVAVKILNPEHFDAYARRLSEEARAVSQLLHDHIVTVSDVGTDSEHSLAFFVMELIEGRDLGSVLWREGPLAWTSVVEIGKQICGALEAAHARGIIHRDIKPANCMLLDGPGINIKVLDFGIAKFTELYLEHRPEVVWSETAHDLPTLGLVGTPGYVAPEQLERSADDPRVDIYGLGAMLYRLLTNKM